MSVNLVIFVYLAIGCCVSMVIMFTGICFGLINGNWLKFVVDWNRVALICFVYILAFRTCLLPEEIVEKIIEKFGSNAFNCWNLFEIIGQRHCFISLLSVLLVEFTNWEAYNLWWMRFSGFLIFWAIWFSCGSFLLTFLLFMFHFA